jgi:hypothetical protein
MYQTLNVQSSLELCNMCMVGRGGRQGRHPWVRALVSAKLNHARQRLLG